jgi:outer membrane protein OmpA-like peptidoglycan-associated protein/tetratricopeptide (TPR) repeat protein
MKFLVMNNAYFSFMYNLKTALFLLLITLFAASCKTQKFEVKDGNTARELLLFNQSTDFLTKEFGVAKDMATQEKIAYRLGDSYKRFNEYANAEKWFQKSVELNGGLLPLFQLGLMQKQQEKYADAIKSFEQYQRNSSGGFEGRQQANQCREALTWLKAFSKTQVTNVAPLNTPNADYALLPYKNNQWIYSSNRTDATGSLKDGWTGEKPSDLFVVDKSTKSFGAVSNLGAPVNSVFHESSPTFSKDLKEVYFVRCGQEEKSNQFCQVYYSAFNNEHWIEPVKLGLFADTVNVYDPHLSKDGKLLFVAASPIDNFGATDLYIFIKADSGWGAPQNLGASINTPGSERFPWLDEKGNLYFSSNGLSGMGGLDIFKAIKTKSGYKDPQNLRSPINSGADDFAFYIDKYKPSSEFDTILYAGYFSSNRAGGKGSDDIYRFEDKWMNFFVLNGKVVEKDFEVADNPDSKVLGLKPMAKAKVELKSTDDKVIATTLTDSKGEFTFNLNAETDYKLTAAKSGYFNNNAQVTTKGKRNQDSTLITVYVQVELEKIFTQKMVAIPNIYYDYDKATLRPESQLVLDSILVFFKENPDLTVEIGSHTDSRGSDAYNLKLSQARAQSVVDYLISKAIPVGRLLAKGYGETKPVNSCTNGAKCTEEEFQKNRRTTFRVVSAKLTIESEEPQNIIVDPKKD